MKFKANLTAERANSVFAYNPETGWLLWRESQGRAKVGSRAGWVRNGYRVVKVDGVDYVEHRVVWLMAHGKWPEGVVDHISMNTQDNRLCNLRDATISQNKMNRRKQANNTSGIKGVYWVKRYSKWSAKIRANGVQKHLGTFATKEEAAEAYCSAASSLHGEFSRVA